MGAERDLSAGEAIGEVVFNTDMTTSQDLLQDPTYSGQIVVQTYPLIGNRGVDPVSPSKFVASGYVVREWWSLPTPTSSSPWTNISAVSALPDCAGWTPVP